MKKVKVYCSICGKPFRKKVRDYYDAYYLKSIRDQITEFCNQCKKEIKRLKS